MRVYAFDSSSLDLLLIGNVEMGLANGKDILEEFTARVLISPEKSGRLRIDLYQVWAVCISFFNFFRCYLITDLRTPHL